MLNKSRQYVLMLFTAAACLCLAACDDIRIDAPSDTSTPEPAEEWDWDRYPVVNTLPLGTVRYRFRANQEQPFTAASDGILRFEGQWSEGKREVEKGEVIAGLAMDVIEIEKQMLALREKALVIKRKQLDTIDEPTLKLELEQLVAEAKRKRDALELMIENVDDSEVLRKLLPDLGVQDSEESLSLLKRRLELLQKELNEGILDLHIDKLQTEMDAVDLERANLELSLRLKQFEITAPFSGTVELTQSGALSEDGKMVVEGGTVVAILRDTSVILVEVKIVDASHLREGANGLELLVHLTGGGRADASYLRTLPTTEESERGVLLQFAIPEKHTVDAEPLIGLNASGVLSRKLPREAHLVPKAAMLTYDSTSFSGEDWRSEVQAKWPGSQVLAVGPTHVAVISPSDSSTSEAEASSAVQGGG